MTIIKERKMRISALYHTMFLLLYGYTVLGMAYKIVKLISIHQFAVAAVSVIVVLPGLFYYLLKRMTFGRTKKCKALLWNLHFFQLNLCGVHFFQLTRLLFPAFPVTLPPFLAAALCIFVLMIVGFFISESPR